MPRTEFGQSLVSTSYSGEVANINRSESSENAVPDVLVRDISNIFSSPREKKEIKKSLDGLRKEYSNYDNKIRGLSDTYVRVEELKTKHGKKNIFSKGVAHFKEVVDTDSKILLTEILLKRVSSSDCSFDESIKWELESDSMLKSLGASNEGEVGLISLDRVVLGVLTGNLSFEAQTKGRTE